MQNQYEILIQNLCVEAIIGIFPQERESPQKVLVNANISYEKQNAYLDYVELASHIAKCLKERKYDLLENALDDIISSLKDSYPSITKINLTLQKPDIFAKDIPIPCIMWILQAVFWACANVWIFDFATDTTKTKKPKSIKSLYLTNTPHKIYPKSMSNLHKQARKIPKSLSKIIKKC